MLDKGNDELLFYCPFSDRDERVQPTENVDLNDFNLDNISW